MIDDKEYQKITKDIAGARTKSRFTYEMFYGIKIIYDLYCNNNDDFFVIFDYACDIEVGTNNLIDFYQVKTKNSGYSFNDLIKRPKEGKPILQTLVNLDASDSVSSLNIVSNSPIKGIKSDTIEFSNLEHFCFGIIPQEYKDQIESNITWPSGTPKISKINYIVSDLCLNTPSKTLPYYTNRFLTGVYGGAPTLINRFEEVIIKMVREKADYNYDTITLNETIKNKGITRQDIEEVLAVYHKEVTDRSMPDVKTFSSKIEEMGFARNKRIELKNEFSRLFGCGYVKESVQEVIDSIKDILSLDEYDCLSDSEAFNKLLCDPRIDFSNLSLDENYKIVVIVYTLMSY